MFGFPMDTVRRREKLYMFYTFFLNGRCFTLSRTTQEKLRKFYDIKPPWVTLNHSVLCYVVAIPWSSGAHNILHLRLNFYYKSPKMISFPPLFEALMTPLCLNPIVTFPDNFSFSYKTRGKKGAAYDLTYNIQSYFYSKTILVILSNFVY